mgnify:CR=1 FL=1
MEISPKSLKIIFIAPKTIERNPRNPYRFDYGFWNFFLPLRALGHETHFFDTSVYGNKELKLLIERIKPDLLFCVMTGSEYYCPDEPWETIEEETRKGRVITFNWFCDDSWRFDDFSKKVCSKFHYCSTPEKQYVEKYKDIGYDNIMYATWCANSDVYSNLNCPRYRTTSFVGSPRGDRKKYIDALGDAIYIPEATSFEDMVWAYSTSLVGLNFSKNSTGTGTQMKARMFEVPAAGSILVSEYTSDLENCYDIGEEILTFTNEAGLVDCINRVLGDKDFAINMAKKGHKRFLAEHDSKIRMQYILERIGNES